MRADQTLFLFLFPPQMPLKQKSGIREKRSYRNIDKVGRDAYRERVIHFRTWVADRGVKTNLKCCKMLATL